MSDFAQTLAELDRIYQGAQRRIAEAEEQAQECVDRAVRAEAQQRAQTNVLEGMRVALRGTVQALRSPSGPDWIRAAEEGEAMLKWTDPK